MRPASFEWAMVGLNVCLSVLVWAGGGYWHANAALAVFYLGRLSVRLW